MEKSNNISQELLETIERYLKKEMDNTERTSFEKQLEENSVLSQQVDDTVLLFSGIKKAVLKDKLEAIHVDMVEKKVPEKAPSKVFKLNFRKLSIAASILILVGGFWLFNQQPNNEKLFNQYFEIDPGLPTVMGDTKEYDFFEAMVDYKRGDYETAISKWQQLEAHKPQNDTLIYFLGAAHLANKNPNEAKKYLEQAHKNKNTPFSQEINLYLGLIYLKQNNLTEAEKYLSESQTQIGNQIIAEFKK